MSQRKQREGTLVQYKHRQSSIFVFIETEFPLAFALKRNRAFMSAFFLQSQCYLVSEEINLKSHDKEDGLANSLVGKPVSADETKQKTFTWNNWCHLSVLVSNLCRGSVLSDERNRSGIELAQSCWKNGWLTFDSLTWPETSFCCQ